jgi:phosphate uptake regulator
MSHEKYINLSYMLATAISFVLLSVLSLWLAQAMEKFAKGDAILTLDPTLEATDATNLAVEKMYELALQCLARKKKNRPSMRRCAEILWTIRKDYRELSQAQPTTS